VTDGGSNGAAWRTRVRALVVHPSEARLLAVRADGLRVLEFELPGSPWVGDPREFLAVLREHVGFDADLLRCVGQSVDEATRTKSVTMLFAARTGAEPPDSMAWLSAAEVGTLAGGPADVADSINQLLGDLAAGTTNEHMPWTNRGWHAEAEDWLRRSLMDIGSPVIGDVEPILSWELSCVLRAQTPSGAVFFKVALDTPLFADEASVVAELAALFPREVPTPLAVDRGRRFLVLADAGPVVGWSAPIEIREEVMRAAARLQIRSAPHVGRLLAAGCNDRRLDWLAAQSSEWLTEVDLSRWLPADEIAELRAAEKRLSEMCAELASLPVPHTIGHGDLHLGNVAQGPDGFVIFDWTDACVVHPFIDMIEIGYEEDEAVAARLLDAYLAAWSGVASAAELRDAWRLAEPLTALNHAISYVSLWSNVAAEAADREFGSATRRFLRRLLEATRRDA
jgi:aminoglycoside phosphotransferase (APT) family kinase protein